MSYLVLARKYRPQTFDDIVGQEHVTRTLASAIASGRVHHAFLFCGARGVGKTTAARILAKCLSCVNAPTSVPCNQCDSCREITAGASVDVQEIDGASNNSVEDVRTLRENVRYLPVRGKKKVYIIDEVHMLSTGAFNALLKTLEEPPPHAVFIFATTEVHKIPITILSRVQRYDFRLVSSSRIAQHLARVLDEEHIAYDPGALAVVAREAGGSVRDSLSLLEQVLAVGAADATSETGQGAAVASEQAAADALGVADRALVGELGRAVLARDPSAALSLVAKAAERNVDMKHLSQVFLEHLRNLVVARVVKEPHALIEASEHELQALVDAARAAPEGLLPLLFDRCAKLVDQVAESPLPRFQLEVGFVELCMVEPLEPLGELVDRLESLESRLGGGGAAAPRPNTARAAAPNPAHTAHTVHTTQPQNVSPAHSSRAPSAPASAAARTPAAMPAAASPAAATPAPSSGPRPTSWQDLYKQLETWNGRIAAFFHSAEEVEFSPDKNRLVIAFAATFDANMARDKLPDVVEFARRVLGAPHLAVQITEGRGRAPSALKAEEQQQKDERETRRSEALQHPARDIIKSTFGDVTFKDPEVE